MVPGLHPLSCSRCGAPLDPGDSVLGALVRCGHCKQAHLWVAPDRVEAQAPPTPVRVRAGAGGPRVMFALVGVVVVLVLAGAAVAVLMLRSRPGTASAERTLPVDAPLVLGDQLEMAVSTKTHFQSCSFTVLGLEADGRVVGVPCGGTNPAPVSRELLRSESYGSSEPGSIVLFRSASGWSRGEVLGPEPGEQLRLRALGEGGSESVVPRPQLFAVQRSGVATMVQAPLPAGAPLEVGDLILRREGAMLEEGKVLTLGDVVRYDRGSAYDGRFESFKEAAKAASPQMLLGRVVTAGTKLEPGNVVLAPAAAGWQRLTVVVEEPHLSLQVTAADGKAQRIVKQGLFLIRVADKAPPAPALAAHPKNVSPLVSGFKKCFDATLAKHPKAQGKVVVTVDVGAKGEVTKVEATPTGDLPPSLVTCIKAHALATKLDPPEGGKASIVIPVAFAAR